MKRIKRIRDHAAVIILHHTSKPGELDRPGTTGARGASAIGASVDGALSLSMKKGAVAVRIAKQRAMRLTEFDYVLEFDDDYAKLVVIEKSDVTTNAVLAALKVAAEGGKSMSRAELLAVVKKTLAGKPSDQAIQNIWWKSMQALMSDGRAFKEKRGYYKATGN